MLIPFFITYDAAEFLHGKIWGYLRLGIVIWLLGYLYKSMRLFYGQTMEGTIFKIWIL
jgi:hypothetical protein